MGNMVDLKWVALFSLILQNSGLAIMMRFTFISAAKDPSQIYISSTAVFNAEVVKLIVASLACYYEDSHGSLQEFQALLYQEFVDNRIDFFKLMIPSLLYTLQNTLQYFSMSCLSAPVFQVLYQMKIITTAIFSVLLLSKRITSFQWVSILALSLGVALVQLSQANDHGSVKSNSIAGLISVMCGCLTSGFAGVYFEMVLKSSKASIWLRNIQLSVIGIVISGMSCYSRDYTSIAQRGFYGGYTSSVWVVVLLQATGGLLVAMVVKYADNVLKGFATSLSILLSSLVSAVYFHDITINNAFVIGSLVVLVSVYLYGYQPKLSLPANMMMSEKEGGGNGNESSSSVGSGSSSSSSNGGMMSMMTMGSNGNR